jgi:lactoylglutathione lyase
MVPSQRIFPMLSVVDLSRALQFYGELLGGTEAYRFPDTGDPAFVVLALGDSQIGLGLMTSPVSPIHGRPLRPASGHRIELCAYVDDVDATVERIRAAGFSIVTEPLDQPWGERVAYVEDPDENLVMLAAV